MLAEGEDVLSVVAPSPANGIGAPRDIAFAFSFRDSTELPGGETAVSGNIAEGAILRGPTDWNSDCMFGRSLSG